MSNPPVQSSGRYLHKADSKEPRLDFKHWLIDPEHLQRVEAIARKYTRGTTISWEDAAQTAHIKLLRAVNRGQFRGEVQDFYRWAATVTRFEIIDLVRKEKQRYWHSLDQPIMGTDLLLGDTVADEFNLLDTVTRSDLLLKALEALANLDRQYPDRNYLKLWQGQLYGKNQTQIAADLGLTQGAVSKRWKELIDRLADMLDLPQVNGNKPLAFDAKADRRKARERSEARW
ncbi:MAG: sigma-70 family RNA polymerase sigma factor [Thermosynechococcaceae cyanobacterium]